MLAPLALILINSMRPTRQIFLEPIGLPESINLDSYVSAWGEANFSEYFFNSLRGRGGVVRWPRRSQRWRPTSWAATRSAAAPSWRSSSSRACCCRSASPSCRCSCCCRTSGLVDSRLGLILVYAATGVPFSVFILSAYFRQLPVDLSEAARMDGAGEFTIFGRVMLPLVRPALATVAVFQFVPLWNDFFFPLVLLRSSEKWTLPVGMTRFFGEFQTDWSTLFAGIVITTLPLIIVFLLATARSIAGLTAGIGKL